MSKSQTEEVRSIPENTKFYIQNSGNRETWCRDLKREIRGSIEKALDEFLKGVGGAVDRVSWVEKFVPITSKEELVLGYIIGTFETFALSVTEFLRQKKLSKAEKEKEDNEIKAMIRRRLPEILDRIESELNK